MQRILTAEEESTAISKSKQEAEKVSTITEANKLLREERRKEAGRAFLSQTVVVLHLIVN